MVRAPDGSQSVSAFGSEPLPLQDAFPVLGALVEGVGSIMGVEGAASSEAPLLKAFSELGQSITGECVAYAIK